LYGERAYWAAAVERYRELIHRAGIPGETSRELLQFRVRPEELVASVCILDLDLGLVERQEPILWERHRANISDTGVWAYISVEREDAQGGIVMEPTYLQSTLRQFSRDWSEGKPL